MLEVQLKGSGDHLKTEPEIKKTVNFYKDASKSVSNKMAGFYISKDSHQDPDPEADTEEDQEADAEVDQEDEQEDDGQRDWQVAQNRKGKLKETPEESSDEDVEDDDDDEGWITPANIKEKRKQMGLELETPADQEQVDVACMTSDFAMQNVLIHMGLNVASPYGCQLIKETKTWILRCHACYKTTPDMSKRFCPNCGNPTLKRVTVTLNEDGTQQIHINAKRQLTSRGKKYSLPAPKGGKYAVNPILTADQVTCKRQITKVAKSKTNAMDPDYVLSNDPFAKNDVTSKSAMMGVNHQSRPYWDYKNPNETHKKTGNRKKKHP